MIDTVWYREKTTSWSCYGRGFQKPNAKSFNLYGELTKFLKSQIWGKIPY